MKPDCEFEFLGLTKDTSLPYYQDVLNEENTFHTVFEALNYFKQYIDEI